jgi:hypothetical protein
MRARKRTHCLSSCPPLPPLLLLPPPPTPPCALSCSRRALLIWGCQPVAFMGGRYRELPVLDRRLPFSCCCAKNVGWAHELFRRKRAMRGNLA